MGFISFRVAPGLRLTASGRGIRAGIGPRKARINIGAGPTTISSGVGPVTVGTSLGGSHRGRNTTPPAVPSSGSWGFVVVVALGVLAIVATCVGSVVTSLVGG